MRAWAVCGMFACSAPAAAPVAPTLPRPVPARTAGTDGVEARGPVDVIASLSAPPKDVATLVPGAAQLALGKASVAASESAQPLDVDMLDQQGNDVRIGVRLDSARFAIWTAKARLLSTLVHDVRIDGDFGFGPDAIEVVLYSGAQVRRLAHEGSRTKIRYVGALEVEGWVADDALSDHGTARPRGGRFPSGMRTLMVTPGTVIRSEAQWIGKQLAVVSQSYFLDTVNQLDDGWYEVAYDDSDVRVHGFASTHDPPGRTHARPAPEPQPPPFTPNATVANHTCLFWAGEPIGFVVGDQQALVEPARQGWMTITLDTPAWGPIAFDARGPNENALEPCGL